MTFLQAEQEFPTGLHAMRLLRWRPTNMPCSSVGQLNLLSTSTGIDAGCFISMARCNPAGEVLLSRIEGSKDCHPVPLATGEPNRQNAHR
jgi:hypothetical protein